MNFANPLIGRIKFSFEKRFNLKLFESLKKLSFLFVRKVKCGRFETVINISRV